MREAGTSQWIRTEVAAGSGARVEPLRPHGRPQTPLLVSVHMPKTAGTSFADSLQARFGARYRADYADLPMQFPPLRRQRMALAGAETLRRLPPRDVDCVHGHFLAVKYQRGLAGRPQRYITWLRDPVERVVSHYAYWRRDYDGSDPCQPLRNRMLAEDWSLERFALGEEMRNLYHQYLWGVDPADFDFIGITERYADDIERMATRYLGVQPVLTCALANPERDDDHYDLPPGFRGRIEAHHADDVALYRWAVARHETGG